MDPSNFVIKYEKGITKGNEILCGYFDFENGNVIISKVIFQLWSRFVCTWLSESVIKLPGQQKKFYGKTETNFLEMELSSFVKNCTNYRYFFNIKVPPKLPGTWEGKHGSIKCVIKIIVESTNKEPLNFEEEVAVLPYRNLKLENNLLKEIEQNITKTFHFTFFSLGSMEINVWLPISGLAVGQSMPLLCTINNKSSITFNTLCFYLNRSEIYRSSIPTVSTKTVTYTITMVKRKIYLTKGCYEYYCVLEVDNKLYPTSYQENEACQVTYNIKMSVSAIPPASKEVYYVETTSIPIVIGTEPLLEWDTNQITNEITKEYFNQKRLSTELDLKVFESEILIKEENLDVYN